MASLPSTSARYLEASASVKSQPLWWPLPYTKGGTIPAWRGASAWFQIQRPGPSHLVTMPFFFTLCRTCDNKYLVHEIFWGDFEIQYPNITNFQRQDYHVEIIKCWNSIKISWLMRHCCMNLYILLLHGLKFSCVTKVRGSSKNLTPILNLTRLIWGLWCYFRGQISLKRKISKL